jgi:hypothetical protein
VENYPKIVLKSTPSGGWFARIGGLPPIKLSARTQVAASREAVFRYHRKIASLKKSIEKVETDLATAVDSLRRKKSENVLRVP